MSKQLTVSAAFSIFTMASFVLLGAQAERLSIADAARPTVSSGIEISAPTLSKPETLLPSLR
jgi:hypothetical protein